MGAALKRSKDKRSRVAHDGELLHTAITGGNFKSVEDLLESGVSPDIVSSTGWSPLRTCLEHDQLDIAQLLISSGADVESKDEEGRSVIFSAVRLNKEDFFNLLIRCGVKVNLTDQNGWTPLHLAAALHHGEYVITKLLEEGTNVNVCNKGKTPLHLAIEFRRSENVCVILKYKPDVRLEQYGNLFNLLMRQLYYSGAIGNVIDSLLDYGFTVNDEDVKSLEFVEAVFRRGSEKLVEHLIERGANPNNDFFGRRMIDVACSSKFVKLVEFMLKHGINLEDSDWAFDSAIDAGDRNVMDVLLKSSLPRSMSRMVFVATRKGSAEILEYLLQLEKPCLNVNSLFGERSLAHYAAGLLNARVLNVLWRHSADLEMTDAEGNTPLHVACLQGFPDTLRGLLHLGADVNALNNGGKTPVEVLVDYYTDKARILRTHIAALQSAGFYVREQLLRLNKLPCSYLHNYIQSEMQEEINGMKENMVADSSVSFYRLLKYSEKEMSTYLSNSQVQETLQSINFTEVFPYYGPLLSNKVAAGLRRKAQVEAALDALLQITFFQFLPLNCIDYILSLLSTEELAIINGLYCSRQVFQKFIIIHGLR